MFSRDPELHPFDENHDVSWDHSQSYCSVSKWLAVCLHFTYFLLHPYAPLFSSFPLSPPSQAAPEKMLIRAQVKSSSRVDFPDETPTLDSCLLFLWQHRNSPDQLKHSTFVLFLEDICLHGQTLPCFLLPSAANHRSLPILPPPPSSPFSTEFSPGPAMTASSHLGEHIWFCKHFIVHITFIVSKTLFGNVFNHWKSITLGPSSSWLLSSLHFTNAALIIGFRYITQRK